MQCNSHITSWYSKFSGSHCSFPPRSIHRMTGLGVLGGNSSCELSWWRSRTGHIRHVTTVSRSFSPFFFSIRKSETELHDILPHWVGKITTRLCKPDCYFGGQWFSSRHEIALIDAVLIPSAPSISDGHTQNDPEMRNFFCILHFTKKKWKEESKKEKGQGD